MRLTEEDQQFVATYDDQHYWHPSVTADSAIFRALDCPENATKKYPQRKLEVLLVKRGRPPYKGGWALPGGFLEKGETLSECAARECLEETGLTPLYQGDVATFSRVDRDPRTRVITQCFLAVVPYGEMGTPKAADDADEAAWFEVSMKTEALSSSHYRTHLTLKNADAEISGAIDLIQNELGSWKREVFEDADTLAFDHLEMICCAVESLRTKLYRSPVAFHWVPDTFRIADLQGVFEAVIGEELLRTTFFEHIKPMIVRAENQPENVGVLDQMYQYKQSYCLEDGLSAIELWRS